MEVRRLFEAGERSVQRLLLVGKQFLGGNVRLDYFEIVDPVSLEAVDRLDRPVLVAVAAFAGETRLIDNITLG